MNRSPTYLLLLLAALSACTPDKKPADQAGRTATAPVARGVVISRGGVVRIAAPLDGALTSVVVDEGDRVAKGQILARLDDQKATLELEAARSEAAERRAEGDAASAKATAAEREASRLSALAAADASPRQDADQAASAAAASRADKQRAIAAWRSAEARVRLAAFEVGSHEIRAPSEGTIVERQAIAGAYVATGAALFAIEPGGQRIVRAELDESIASTVAPGRTATISAEFSGSSTCVARVSRVADALTAPSLTEEGAPRPDQRVVVAVLPLASNCALPLGQRVLVRFER